MIHRQIVLLAKSLHELKGASLTKLEGRIAFQKKIYLLQAAGVNLGYDFTWDIYGPYSQGLARDGAQYEVNRELADRLADEIHLSEKGDKRFARARQLMALPASVDNVRESLWLEILSSIHFCLFQEASNDSVPPRDSEVASNVISRLLKRKPHLRDREDLIDFAWVRLSA